MAKQINFMNVNIRYQRQDDGSYLTTIASLEAHVSDPAGSSDVEKKGAGIGSNDANPIPVYSGTQTSDALMAACENVIKSVGGVV